MAVISRRDLIATYESVARDAASILRLIAWMLLASGVVITVAIVAAEEQTRGDEIAVRKALGARPWQIRSALLSEFGLLGALAGVLGGIAGSALATLLLSLMFRRLVIAWSIPALASAIALGAALAAISGVVGSAGTLRRRPMPLLRDE